MEKVQLALERQIGTLRDLAEKKVFTKDEISDIVNKLRAFETALASREVKPADYLRYIDYESKLERLRKARAARLQTSTKKTLSDHSIAAQVTHLHRLATRRFPESLELWNAFIAHSLTQASPLLVSRTLSSAIAMHPTHVAYWLMASRWESDGDEKGMGGGNTEAARRLCMRALRFLKGRESDEMLVWKEWVRVECSFAERVKARWALLGIGKGKNGMEEITRVDGKKTIGAADDDEQADVEVEVPMLEGAAAEEQAMQEQVEKQALTGQEAIIDGAIVRVVIDNCLSSFKHSLAVYNSMISVLRPLPSALRLPLLAHIYVSLKSHTPPSSALYPQAVRVLATRHLYDVPYDAKKAKKAAAAGVSIEYDGQIMVTGEKLVDAIAYATEVYWKACKGKKGKSKDRAPVAVWESFCGWLEEISEDVDDENLDAFLTTNLTTALAIAPSSPFLSLLHLRHLLRTSAQPNDVLTFAKEMAETFGMPPSAQETAEEIWVACVETFVSLSPSAADTDAVLQAAIANLPFSGRLWDVDATWIEQNKPEEATSWYEASVQRVMLADATPPINFHSKFADQVLPPRELVPRRYLAYVSTTELENLELKIHALLNSVPMLSLEFLKFVLEDVALGLEFEVGSRAHKLFRERVWERVVLHPHAGPAEWVEYAQELLSDGQVTKSSNVMRRAEKAVKSVEQKGELERRWQRVVDA